MICALPAGGVTATAGSIRGDPGWGAPSASAGAPFPAVCAVLLLLLLLLLPLPGDGVSMPLLGLAAAKLAVWSPNTGKVVIYFAAAAV